jgi:hypothetical protein
LTETCLKVGKKFLGPSKHNSTNLNAISQSLYCFNGTLRNLQTHCEINGDDQDRLGTLNHLADPLKRSEDALKIISKRLENVNMLGQYVVGKPFDRELQKSLRALEEARKLFELALHSDNR